MANPGGTSANLKPPWKPGKSANPKGRPSVDQKLKELREKYGNNAQRCKALQPSFDNLPSRSGFGLRVPMTLQAGGRAHKVAESSKSNATVAPIDAQTVTNGTV